MLQSRVFCQSIPATGESRSGIVVAVCVQTHLSNPILQQLELAPKQGVPSSRSAIERSWWCINLVVREQIQEPAADVSEDPVDQLPRERYLTSVASIAHSVVRDQLQRTWHQRFRCRKHCPFQWWEAEYKEPDTNVSEDSVNQPPWGRDLSPIASIAEDPANRLPWERNVFTTVQHQGEPGTDCLVSLCAPVTNGSPQTTSVGTEVEPHNCRSEQPEVCIGQCSARIPGKRPLQGQ